jgi:hypothetical protein
VIDLCPVGTDARFALDELNQLDCFDGDRDESKKALTGYIRHSALFDIRKSYRWVQRIFNSIWRNYDGLLEAKKANLAAVVGAARSTLRADERKTRDAARKAATRSADPRVKRRVKDTKATLLRDQAAKLRTSAGEKEIKALALLAAARKLNAEAVRAEAQADQLTASD